MATARGGEGEKSGMEVWKEELYEPTRLPNAEALPTAGVRLRPGSCAGCLLPPVTSTVRWAQRWKTEGIDSSGKHAPTRHTSTKSAEENRWLFLTESTTSRTRSPGRVMPLPAGQRR